LADVKKATNDWITSWGAHKIILTYQSLAVTINDKTKACLKYLCDTYKQQGCAGIMGWPSNQGNNICSDVDNLKYILKQLNIPTNDNVPCVKPSQGGSGGGHCTKGPNSGKSCSTESDCGNTTNGVYWCQA
jgi:hypothetical protein